MSRSASLTSSSVALKDSIRVCGRLRKNPTVSVKQNALFIGQSETARRRIESGEKFIDCEDVSAGHQVQQRGFSGVGVTNDSCDWPLMALAALPLHAAHFAHAFQLALETRDPILDPAPIDLQLGFARSPRPNSAGLRAKGDATFSLAAATDTATAPVRFATGLRDSAPVARKYRE